MTQAVNLHDRLRAGLCCEAGCANPLEHGPYSDDQIANECADMGIAQGEFSDMCDDCFVSLVGRGDARYAAGLAGRPLKLRNPGLVFGALLGAAYE